MQYLILTRHYVIHSIRISLCVLLLMQTIPATAQNSSSDSGRWEEQAQEYIWRSAKNYAIQAAKGYLLGYASPFIDGFFGEPKGPNQPSIVDLSEAAFSRIRDIVAEETWKAVQAGLVKGQRDEATAVLGQLETQINAFTLAIQDVESKDERFANAKPYLVALDTTSASLVNKPAFLNQYENFYNAPLFAEAASMRLSVLQTREMVENLSPAIRQAEAGQYIQRLKKLYQSFYQWNENRFEGPVSCGGSSYTYLLNGVRATTCIGWPVGYLHAENRMHTHKNNEFDALKADLFGGAQAVIDLWAEIAEIDGTRLEEIDGEWLIGPPGLKPSGLYSVCRYLKSSGGCAVNSPLKYLYLYSDTCYMPRPNYYCEVEDLESAKALTGYETIEYQGFLFPTGYEKYTGLCTIAAYRQCNFSDQLIYVDSGYEGVEWGTLDRPFNTVVEAFEVASSKRSWAEVIIKEGSYVVGPLVLTEKGYEVGSAVLAGKGWRITLKAEDGTVILR